MDRTLQTRKDAQQVQEIDEFERKLPETLQTNQGIIVNKEFMEESINIGSNSCS